MLYLILLRFALLGILGFALFRWSLARLEQASQDLEDLGLPFTISNWIMLPQLRAGRRHERRRLANDQLTALLERKDQS